jgi:FixJ family two-component response regulator
MDRLLNISIIGDDKKLVDDFSLAAKDSTISLKISSYSSNEDFLKNQPQFSPDLILSIVPSSKSDWKFIINELNQTQQLPFIIFILPDNVENSLSLQMIDAGAYDVIKKKVFNDLPVLMNRVARDIEHRSESGYFSTDKNISDHILNYSRSMLTIINRDYRYEQANRFCCW